MHGNDIYPDAIVTQSFRSINAGTVEQGKGNLILSEHNTGHSHSPPSPKTPPKGCTPSSVSGTIRRLHVVIPAALLL